MIPMVETRYDHIVYSVCRGKPLASASDVMYKIVDLINTFNTLIIRIFMEQYKRFIKISYRAGMICESLR